MRDYDAYMSLFTPYVFLGMSKAIMKLTLKHNTWASFGYS